MSVKVPPEPHQGVPVVFEYKNVDTNTIHLMYIGVHAYKYLGHEPVNWLEDVDRYTDTVGGVTVDRCRWGSSG